MAIWKQVNVTRQQPGCLSASLSSRNSTPSPPQKGEELNVIIREVKHDIYSKKQNATFAFWLQMLAQQSDNICIFVVNSRKQFSLFQSVMNLFRD